MSFRVNLALAYTELTEELGRLRELSSLQGRILRTLLQEQARSPGEMGGGEGEAGELGPKGVGQLWLPSRVLGPRLPSLRRRLFPHPRSEESGWALGAGKPWLPQF